MSETQQFEVLFGRIALACGYCDEDELMKAIDVQRRSDEHRHLGRVMIDLGVLGEDELLTVLAIQRENRAREELSYPVRQMGAMLGALAVQRGWCKRNDVLECIEEQARLQKLSLYFRLGEVMVSRGKLTNDQVSALLNEQKIRILGCPDCFSQYNVQGYAEDEVVNCPNCGVPLIVPKSVQNVRVAGTLKRQAH
ncbi:MAG: hypothetical protein KDB07_09405 [Planctomycetes bacterium]|nr:hypothetical protein [Planctomycetota bacterium]